MRSLDLYIFRQVILAAIFLAGGLTFAVWLTQSLRFIDYIVNKGLPLISFISLVGLMLPSFLSVVLPVAIFIATLFIYNKLIQDSEMIVMRAAGISPWGLARPALAAALLVTVILYTLTLYLMPAAYGAFKAWQQEIRSLSATLVLQEGTFNPVVKGVTVFLRSRGRDGRLEGIFIHDERNKNSPVTLLAQSGALVETDDGPLVILRNGDRLEFEAGKGPRPQLSFEKYEVELGSEAETPKSRFRESTERFVWELLDAESDPKLTDAQARHFRAEGHARLANPLYPLAFVLIALAALMTSDLNRRGQTILVLIAAGAVILVQVGAFGWPKLAAKAPAVTFMIYANPILAMLLSAAFLTRSAFRRSVGRGLPVAPSAAE